MRTGVLIAAIFAGVCTLPTTQARAANVTGNHIRQYCELYEREGPKSANSMFCIAYIDGIVYGWTTVNIINNIPNKDRFFCPPENSTSDQNVRVVMKYIRAHPEYLHLDGANVIVGGLQESYICPAK